MSDNKLYKFFWTIGIGGMGCPCCAPKPGKDKRKRRKEARRKLKQWLDRQQRKEESE